jgi:hypothetical protein
MTMRIAIADLVQAYKNNPEEARAPDQSAPCWKL